MTPEQLNQLSGLYHAALDLEPEQRDAFLREACRGDEQLLREVHLLLGASEQAGSFLASPVPIEAATVAVQAKSSEVIGRRFGHFRIESHIGAGGMGEVYLALDEKLDRKVALKLLPAEFAADPDRLRRFTVEAKSASATDHPNIITIHDIGETDGIHYIAQEFVEGETLRRYIERGPIPLLDALSIAHQIANALAAAHASGIVHRDIKPENIMLRHDGFVKVLDFGLAGMNPTEAMAADMSNSPTLPKQTAPGIILGTVNYMSPEQTRGQKLDARTDLWSLGVVLYEMLTGQRPFRGESMPDIFVAILERQPTPLAELLDDAPVQLQQILDNLLAKNREQRYPSSRQLAAELKRFHHRLELDAERDAGDAAQPRTLFFNSPAKTAQSQLSPLPATQEQLPAHDTIANRNEPVTKELAAVARLSRATVILVCFLFVAVIAIASWMLFQQKGAVTTPPTKTTDQVSERSFNYSLTVQKMRDRKSYQPEFQSSGRDIYENGWKFRLNFSSPQSGYLYIINEGPTVGGAISYSLLFPMPSINDASAKVEAGVPLQTNTYDFDKHAGIEKFWIVWARQAIAELEEIKAVVLNDNDKGFITNARQRDLVRALLSQYNAAKGESSEDRLKKQTMVEGRGELLLHLIELEHH